MAWRPCHKFSNGSYYGSIDKLLNSAGTIIGGDSYYETTFYLVISGVANY